MSANDLTGLHPQEFVAFAQKHGIRRCHFVWDETSQSVQTSHAELAPIVQFLEEESPDFMQHEGLFLQINEEHATLQGAFVHRTVRGQAAGGVRYWTYETLGGYLRDGLRLAVGMSRKNALAGLWWGGGKGVMARNPGVDRDDRNVRDHLYRDYGQLMSALRGCYVTAEDVGTSVEDMAQVFATTRFTTCIPPELGGSGNPSIPTARGVVAGMEAAIEFLGQGTLQDKVVAVQGVGHVGGPLVGLLFARGVKKVYACDIDADLLESLQSRWPERMECRAVSADDPWIYEVECDIFAPCATGAVLNPETIPKLRSSVVCGAANNQLADERRDDALLLDRGIHYVPDFLTNRMGIVACADEGGGSITPDPGIERHLGREWEHSIHQTCLRVLREAHSSQRPTSAVATETADHLTQERHPIFGHRGRQIIDSLVRERWFDS